MIDIIRDSTVGQIVNKLSSGRFLPYADQRPDYVVPERYRLNGPSLTNTITEDTTPRKSAENVRQTLATLAVPESAVTSSNVSMRTLVRESFSAEPEHGASEKGLDLEGGS